MTGFLKKSMVYLGLAEDNLEPQSELQDTVNLEREVPVSAATPAQSRAQVTPLRKVNTAQQSVSHSMNEILTVHPTAYRDASTIAENFRAGVPVILNLSRMNEGEARRLIDFASGLTMGLGGAIERVTSKVFLLSPEHIAVSSDEQVKEHDNDSRFVEAVAASA